MTALQFFLGVLAAYRVARMIAIEDGPFDIFSTLRDWAGQKSWLGRGLGCVLCLSFWLAWGAALLVPYTNVSEYALHALAIAGGVVIVHKVIA